LFSFFFFFNDTATTEIYTLSLHDALPICQSKEVVYRSLEMPMADGVRLHGLLTRANRETEDAKEAFRARNEKRKPEYKGR